MKKILTLALAGSIAATAAFSADLKGSGASFPYSVYQQWLKDYNKATGIEVDYIKKGSSKGIADITARHVDFAGSDAPLSSKKLAEGKLYQFPAVVGAITMAYNIPGVNEIKLSRAAIASIASGKVEYWDDKVIADANKDVKLPHEKVTFVHRADGSGTTFNFTYYLSLIDQEWAKNFGAKKSLNWPGNQHIGGKKNDGVGAAIKSTPFSVGYIDYADAKKAELPMALVENKEGNYIKPEFKYFAEGAGKAAFDPKMDFYHVPADPAGAESYPMIAATFILLPTEATDMNKKVTAFYDWAFKNEKAATESLGFVHLPTELTTKITEYWTEKGVK